MLTKSDPKSRWWARYALPTLRICIPHLCAFNRSAIRSAIATVVRWVLARGTSGMIEASITRSPVHPITRHSGSTTERGSSTAPMRQVPLACWASPHSANIQSSSSASAERLVHRASGRAIFDAVRDVGDRRLQADLAQAPHAVAHAHQIAAIGQHALLDRRLDRGIGGGDADVALAEGLIDRHRDASARGDRRRCGSRARLPAIMIMSLSPAPARPERVAQAAIGVAVHQRADLAVLAQMQQRIHDRMIEQVFADRQVGEDRDAERLQQRCRADAGALQDRRRVDRAGAEDHLARRATAHRLAVDAHADRTLACSRLPSN